MTETKCIEFNCPVKLLEVFDEVIQEYYADRTKALLEAMRDFIRKLEEEKRQRRA
jgi:metal-responsive CopG/Arc/MetJ family transcriptional regulator